MIPTERPRFDCCVVLIKQKETKNEKSDPRSQNSNRRTMWSVNCKLWNIYHFCPSIVPLKDSGEIFDFFRMDPPEPPRLETCPNPEPRTPKSTKSTEIPSSQIGLFSLSKSRKFMHGNWKRKKLSPSARCFIGTYYHVRLQHSYLSCTAYLVFAKQFWWSKYFDRKTSNMNFQIRAEK